MCDIKPGEANNNSSRDRQAFSTGKIYLSLVNQRDDSSPLCTLQTIIWILKFKQEFFFVVVKKGSGRCERKSLHIHMYKS